jgi:uncharacterized repeat protein (TIGR03809 family)
VFFAVASRFTRATANVNRRTFMNTHPIVPTADVAQKYLALIEQRRAHLAELYDSGRWTHYYSEAEFLARVRELMALRDQWAAVAALGRNGLPALRRWEMRAPPAGAQPAGAVL